MQVAGILLTYGILIYQTREDGDNKKCHLDENELLKIIEKTMQQYAG